MLLRWQSKPRFDASRPASGRLPARSGLLAMSEVYTDRIIIWIRLVLGGGWNLECFRIDESGYTGFDLLNSEQRFQGAAAIAIDDAEARRLIREHFPKLQADELKYRALARRPANRPRLLALQRDLLSHHKCVTYVCDKRYLLLLMFLDYAVEPFYY